MRDKMLAVLLTFSEGATVERALKEHGKGWGWFYKTLDENPDLKAVYRSHRKNRADMAGDRAFTLIEDCVSTPEKDAAGAVIEKPDAARVRVALEGYLKLMAKYDPNEFGDRVNLQLEAKPNLVAAIDEGKRRAALPQRDPALVIDAQYTEIQPITHADTSDKQSAAPAFAIAPGDIDPFAP